MYACIYRKKYHIYLYKTIKLNLLSDYCVTHWCLCESLLIESVVSWQAYKLTSWHIGSGLKWGIQYRSLHYKNKYVVTLQTIPIYFNDNIIKCFASSNPKLIHYRAFVIFINIWPDVNITKPKFSH